MISDKGGVKFSSSMILLALWLAATAVASNDLCATLCAIHGASTCTHGSSESVDGSCRNYFIKQDSSGYCYTLQPWLDCPLGKPLFSKTIGAEILGDTNLHLRRLSEESGSEDGPVQEIPLLFSLDSPRVARRNLRSEQEAPEEIVIGVENLDIPSEWYTPNLFAHSWLRRYVQAISDPESKVEQGELWQGAVADMMEAGCNPSEEDWDNWNADALIGITLSSSFADLVNHRDEILQVSLALVSYISGVYSPLSQVIVERSRVHEMCELHRDAIKQAVLSRYSATWNHRIEVVGSRESLNRALFELTPFSRGIHVCPDVFSDVDMKQVVLSHRMQGIVWREFLRPRKQVLRIDRETFLSDSLSQVMQSSSARLRAGLAVEYVGEDGVDRGGLGRDWFSQLALEIFSPANELFKLVENGKNIYRIQPSVNGKEENRKSVFRAIGRIVALSIHHKSPLGVQLPLTMWRQVLSVSTILKQDVEFDDPILLRSLNSLLDTDLSSEQGRAISSGLTMSFFDGSAELPLVQGGSNIPVSENNKFEYVGAVLIQTFQKSIQKELAAFTIGFTDIIPLHLIRDFLTPKDLNYLLQGESYIEVKNLEQNCILIRFIPESPQIVWFWEILRDETLFTQEKLRELLRFVTGDGSVPLGGFKNLRNPFKISLWKHEAPDVLLPTSGTCFFTLHLPEYSSKTILQQKLIQSIESNSGFHLAL